MSYKQNNHEIPVLSFFIGVISRILHVKDKHDQWDARQNSVKAIPSNRFDSVRDEVSLVVFNIQNSVGPNHSTDHMDSDVKNGTSDKQVERCDFDGEPSLIVIIFDFRSLLTKLSQSTDEPLSVKDAGLVYHDLGNLQELCDQGKTRLE